MRVATFNKLVSIGKLAALDGGTNVITLSPTDAGISASFEGLHTAVDRVIGPGPDGVEIEGLTEPVAIGWDIVSKSLPLLDADAPLKARIDSTHLHLQSGRRRMNLVLKHNPSRFQWLPDDSPGFVIVPVDELPSLVAMLSVTAANTIEKPVLTGINVAGVEHDGKKQLVMRSTDGTRALLATVDALDVQGTVDFTVQAADLVTALGILDGNIEMRVLYEGRILLLKDDVTVVRMSLLPGEFPSFTALPSKNFTRKIKLNTEMVQLIRRASEVLDRNRLVTLSVEGGTLRLSAQDQEVGEFEVETDVEGQTDETFSITFDSDYLSASIGLGDEITFNIMSNTSPVMVRGKTGVVYWLSPIVRR